MTRYVEAARKLDTSDYTEESAFYRLLGSSICRARLKCGLEQKELALELGISQSAMSRLELGKIHVSVYQLKRVSERLHVKLSELIPK